MNHSEPAAASHEAAKEAAYTKQQCLASRRFARHRDVLSGLLEEQASYTTAQVEQIISEFMKRKVL